MPTNFQMGLIKEFSSSRAGSSSIAEEVERMVGEDAQLACWL